MVNKKDLEMLDRTIRYIRGINEFMGSALVLLARPFRQTLRVIQQGNSMNFMHV